MLNNAEPCRRALCSCCVRRTMKDSPSDSWLHLAGSITLSVSFSLALSLSHLLPSLLCGPEWQGDSRLGISQSLPSSSVPSACQAAKLLIPGRDGTLLGEVGRRGCETTEETAGAKGGKCGELRRGRTTQVDAGVGAKPDRRMGGCQARDGKTRVG